MSRLVSLLIQAYRALIGITFLVLIFAVLVQIVGRLAGDAPVWTEELTRFALLYLVALGVGMSYRTGDLVNVDLVCDRLPGIWPKVLRFFTAVLIVGLCALLILPAWKYTEIGAMQTSPALGWRMDFIHASVLILLISLFVFSLMRVVAMVAGKSDGQATKGTEE